MSGIEIQISFFFGWHWFLLTGLHSSLGVDWHDCVGTVWQVVSDCGSPGTMMHSSLGVTVQFWMGTMVQTFSGIVEHTCLPTGVHCSSG